MLEILPSPTVEGTPWEMMAGAESLGAAQAGAVHAKRLALAEVGDTWESRTRGRGKPLSPGQLLAWLGPVQSLQPALSTWDSEDLRRMQGLDGLSGPEALAVKSRWRKEGSIP